MAGARQGPDLNAIRVAICSGDAVMKDYSYLCECGHEWCEDWWDDSLSRCVQCGAQVEPYEARPIIEED